MHSEVVESYFIPFSFVIAAHALKPQILTCPLYCFWPLHIP